MSNKVAKHHSEVKTSRIDRKWVNASTWHKLAVKRYNKASRKASKLALKEVA